MNGEKPISGVLTLEDGSKVIPGSKRADGTVRKERRVKAGFTPAEDVRRYVNPNAAAAHVAQERVKEVLGARYGSQLVKDDPDVLADRKRVKNKKKKNGADSAPENNNTSVSETPSNEQPEKNETVAVVEDESKALSKRIRNVKKKLKQIEELKSKPFEQLDADQQEKVKRQAQVEEELSGLMSQLELLEKSS